MDQGMPALFAAPDVERSALPAGGWLYRSRMALQPHAPHIAQWLWHWAEHAPTRPYILERDADGAWTGATYAEVAAAARAIGQALLDRGLGPDRPIAVLSGNSVRHALLLFGAQAAGVPIASVSVPYSLASADHGKLRHVLRTLRPGLIFAEDASAFARALAVPEAAAVAAIDGAALDGMRRTIPGAAWPVVDPDGPARVLFTSGSTGVPKGVVLTHRMLAANQQQIAQVWPILLHEPPIMLDWLPWSHVFAGAHNVNCVLRHGGTLYLDEGRPMPGAFAPTLRNLAEVSPTLRLDVPRGYAMLLPELEADAALAEAFFARLRFVFSAAAALPEGHFRRLQALAERHGGAVPVISSWGLTETSPACTSTHRVGAPPGGIGTPLPGCDVKLVPNDGKLEIRVRGPQVFSRYLDDPAATATAFDPDGFFITGDAVAWVNEEDLAHGLRFDGRIVEDFKLGSGTRVNSAELRGRALTQLQGLVRDVVVVGADRDYVGLFVFPPDPTLAEDAAWRGRLRDGVAALNAASGGGGSRTIARALVLREPPVLDAGEITDKGSLNVRAITTRRAADLDRLYAEPTDPEVIIP